MQLDMKNLTGRVCSWFFRYEGSTRSTAVLRMGLAALIFFRFDVRPSVGVPDYGIFWAIVFYASIAGMFLGVFSRASTFIAGLITAVMYYYFWYVRNDVEWAHHHTYLLAVVTLLLSAAPCGRSFSIDRWLAVRKAQKAGLPLPVERGNLFALRLISLQLVALYFFAFWDKFFVAGSNEVFVHFLNGDRLQQIILFNYVGSGFVAPAWTGYIAAFASIAVTGLELILPLLLFQPFQKWLVLPGIALHVAFWWLLPLQTYSLTCILLYFAIFNADKVHAYTEMLGRWRRTPAEPTEAQT